MPNSGRIAHCMDCGTQLRGRQYCGQCGQRNVHRRLVWQAITNDLKTQLLEWDLPWFYTIKELTLRPGKVIREYIDGHRAKYVNPMKYVVYVIAIGSVIVALLPDNLLMHTLDYMADEPQNPLAKGLVSNPAIILMLASPLAVLFLRVAFWNSPLNRTEMYCFVFYVIGHAALIVYLILILAAITYAVFPVEVPLNFSTFPTNTLVMDVATQSMAYGLPLYAAYASVGVFGVRTIWSVIATFLVAFLFTIFSLGLFAAIASL